MAHVLLLPDITVYTVYLMDWYMWPFDEEARMVMYCPATSSACR